MMQSYHKTRHDWFHACGIVHPDGRVELVPIDMGEAVSMRERLRT